MRADRAHEACSTWPKVWHCSNSQTVANILGRWSGISKKYVSGPLEWAWSISIVSSM